MNIIRNLILISIFFFAAQAAKAEPADNNAAQFMTQEITVDGEVEQPLNLSVEKLRDFPLHQLQNVPLVCQSGATVGELLGTTAVRLTDILQKAKIKTQTHNDLKRTIIVATASDGYKAVFSWNELFNTSIGEGVMVLIGQNGQLLPPHEGRIAMLSTQDIKNGPRHVRWLQRIDVIRLAP